MRCPFYSNCYVVALDPETGKGVLAFRYNAQQATGWRVAGLGKPLAKGLGGCFKLHLQQAIPLK